MTAEFEHVPLVSAPRSLPWGRERHHECGLGLHGHPLIGIPPKLYHTPGPLDHPGSLGHQGSGDPVGTGHIDSGAVRNDGRNGPNMRIVASRLRDVRSLTHGPELIDAQIRERIDHTGVEMLPGNVHHGHIIRDGDLGG